VKQILYFSAGLALGGLVGWYLTKRHYENLIDDEIEEVKEAYKEDIEEVRDNIRDNKIYRAKVRNLGYIDNGVDSPEDYYIKDEVDEELRVTNPFPGEPADSPYTIGPDAYNDDMIFDKQTITYYAGNDALVTDEDEVLYINDTIGRESLDKFGEYEEDTVYVRNEKLGMDYEVVYFDGCYVSPDEGGD
jgi:hypothetical protein